MLLAIWEEAQKLKDASFIQPVRYHEWISNMVMV